MWVAQNTSFPQVGLFLCAVLVLLTACEEPIDSPIELVEPRLVMTSTFAPGKMVEVRLSATQSPIGEARVLDIRDADIRIYEGQDLLEKLHYRPGTGGATGFYSTMHFQPVVGQQYSILANARGFTPISAESSIPTSVPIRSLKISNLSVQDGGSFHLYDFVLSVDYEDPAAEMNFYDLRISQQVIPFRVNGLRDTTFYDAVAKSVQPPGAIIGNGPSLSQSSVLVMDKPDAFGLEVQLQVRIDPNQEILGDLVAELRTVSEPYFQFQRTIQEVGSVYSGISEQRVNGYTNVRQGYGLFAGYNSVEDRINILGH
ncbi:MAG: DUF4249 domain-containing protein [Bacteroidota bacterium]